MSRQTIIYALFCLSVVVAFIWATRDGYSPFADGGARGIARTAVGPTHK